MKFYTSCYNIIDYTLENYIYISTTKNIDIMYEDKIHEYIDIEYNNLTENKVSLVVEYLVLKYPEVENFVFLYNEDSTSIIYRKSLTEFIKSLNLTMGFEK